MSKPFFYRLNAADFFAVVRNIPNKDCAKWLRTFASDLVSGESQDNYTLSLIEEAKKFRENKSLAGKKGMKSRYQRSNTVITELQQNDNTDITNSSSSTITIIKDKTLSSSGDEEHDFYLTKKRKKLKGKRLETFNQFWEAFGKKEGKAEAADAWMEIPVLTEKIFSEILTAARRENEGRPKLLAAGKTPKMAQGWITGRRWEDERQEVESWRLI